MIDINPSPSMIIHYIKINCSSTQNFDKSSKFQKRKILDNLEKYIKNAYMSNSFVKIGWNS